MKYFVQREGISFSVVVFTENEVVAKVGIAGQELGQFINKFPVGERLEKLPKGMWIRNGAIGWKVNESALAA